MEIWSILAKTRLLGRRIEKFLQIVNRGNPADILVYFLKNRKNKNFLNLIRNFAISQKKSLGSLVNISTLFEE